MICNTAKLLPALIIVLAGVTGAAAQDRPEERPVIPLPPPIHSTPSDGAKKAGYKENSDFTGPKVDYSRPGYVGDYNDRGHPLVSEDVKKTTPKCDVLDVLDVGDAAAVKDCATAPASYKALCDTAFENARTECANLCKNALACKNPVLRPHIYEEWGCTTPPVKPFQYCQLYEGCTCTRSPD